MLTFPKPVINLRPGMHVWYVHTKTAAPVEAVVCALTSTTEYSPTRDEQVSVPAAKLHNIGTHDTITSLKASGNTVDIVSGVRLLSGDGSRTGAFGVTLVFAS